MRLRQYRAESCQIFLDELRTLYYFRIVPWLGLVSSNWNAYIKKIPWIPLTPQRHDILGASHLRPLSESPSSPDAIAMGYL